MYEPTRIAAKDDEDVEGEDSGSEEDMSPRAVQLGLSQPDYRFIRQLMKKYDFSDNNFMEIREAAHFLQDLNKGRQVAGSGGGAVSALIHNLWCHCSLFL